MTTTDEHTNVRRQIIVDVPPERLVISWDITAKWELETDPERASEVEVRFLPTGDGGQTRVVLEHRHLHRHGQGWQDYRDVVAGGWPAFLENFRVLTLASRGAA